MAVELRIHGVSGTPADRVLGAASGSDERFAAEPATVLRRLDGDDTVLAYRWASQTSGTAGSSMWLLLVPYMLLNLAGWALPPATDQRHRLSVAAIRISGLFLTLVFALITANGVIGVGAYQVVRDATSWRMALTLGVAVSAMVMVVLWFATTRADEARNDRPYLRAPHIAVALWGIWATAVTAAAEASGNANPIGTMWLLPAALALLIAAASLWRDLEDLTRLLGRVAVGASLVLLVSVVVRPLDTIADLPATLTSIGGPARGAVLAYAAIAFVATALAWSPTHPDAGPAVGSLLALAGASGAAVGAGAVVVTGAAFGVATATGLGILAEGFLVGSLCLVAITSFHAWTHLEPGATPRERLMLTLVSVRDDIRPLLLAVPVVTLAIGAVAIGRLGDAYPWIAAGAYPVAFLAMAAVAYRLGFSRSAVVIVVAAGLAGAMVVTGLVSLRASAVGFTLILPAIAVAARIAGGFGSVERRRMLAIPWDVGSFFSRRFHPFAPPTYRDVVERDLKMVLTQLRASGEPVVVSAHSQGSILAVSALDGVPGDNLRLLTHGSPLAPLFMRFFPVSFPPEIVPRIGRRPWINLWRPTDPVGGAVRGTDDRRVPDRNSRIHGGYWLADEPEYARAVADLVAAESRT
ncbi:MAG TPA: hypothetical protein VMS74_11485 [Acidimicrobiia bacterium]|nr:hypothetical protein [Acidimicrobiia bacterium]